jgi:MoaA/NifB/PqqE/SkfB family radical SAM enzyme
MINKIKKGFEGLKHPGISSSPFKLIRNGTPYLFSGKIKVPPPLTVYWSINSVCNLRCKMCDVGTANEEGTFFKTLRINRKLHEIPIELFKSVVDETKTFKPLMAINSTEPLMYKPIIEAVDYCTSSSIKTAITTGAYKLPELAKDLVNAGLTRLNVSIDGPQELHNTIRGRKDVFQRAIEGIRVFDEESKRKGITPEIFINYTITNLNFDNLYNLEQDLKEVNYTKINYVLMWFLSPEIVKMQNQLFDDYKVSVSCFDDHVNPKKVDVEKLLNEVSKVSKNPRTEILFHNKKNWLEHYFVNYNELFKNAPGCMASWFFTQILADGKVVVYTRCHNKEFGNIHDEPLMQIWNGEKMKGWRTFIKREQKMPMCARCDLAY